MSFSIDTITIDRQEDNQIIHFYGYCVVVSIQFRGEFESRDTAELIRRSSFLSLHLESFLCFKS